MSEETSISLYLDLEEGQAADIEVVARAALAFSAAIKALAADLAPGAVVRVELVSGTAGSLSLNSLIKALGLQIDREKLKNIALALAAYIALETRDYTFGRVLDWLTDKEPEAARNLTDEDVKAIAKALQSEPAQRPMRQVFKEVERDGAIRGVGVTDTPGARPALVIPRAAFPERAGMVVQEQTSTKRIVPLRIPVVLVSPVLVEGDRRWKFQGPSGEFGASVKDATFIQSVLSGTTAVPMVAGILMDVEVESNETLKDGVWVVDSRVVTHVYGVKPPETLSQASLFSSDAGDQKGENDD